MVAFSAKRRGDTCALEEGDGRLGDVRRRRTQHAGELQDGFVAEDLGADRERREQRHLRVVVKGFVGPVGPSGGAGDRLGPPLLDAGARGDVGDRRGRAGIVPQHVVGRETIEPTEAGRFRDVGHREPERREVFEERGPLGRVRGRRLVQPGRLPSCHLHSHGP